MFGSAGRRPGVEQARERVGAELVAEGVAPAFVAGEELVEVQAHVLDAERADVEQEREVVEHAALDMQLRRRSQASTSVCAQLSYCLHFLGLPEARLDGSGMVTWTHRHSEPFDAQPVPPRPMLPASQLMACGSVGQLMAMPVDAHRLMFQNLCSLHTPRNAARFAMTCKALHESLCSMYWLLRCAVWRATDVCRGLRRAKTIRAAPVGTVGDAEESDLPLGKAFNSLRRNRALVIAFDLGPLEWLPLGPYDGCLLYTSPSPRDATLSRMPSSA